MIEHMFAAEVEVTTAPHTTIQPAPDPSTGASPVFLSLVLLATAVGVAVMARRAGERITERRNGRHQ